MQLTKKIKSFPRVGPSSTHRGPDLFDLQNRYQHLPSPPTDKAQYRTNSLAITDCSRIHNNNNNNNNNLNLQNTDNPAICLPCGHILCKSCAKNWLSIKPSCSTCRHPVPVEHCFSKDGHQPLHAHAKPRQSRIYLGWSEGIHLGFRDGLESSWRRVG